MRRTGAFLLMSAILTMPVGGQQAPAIDTSRAEPPRFIDAQRREKLASAFPAIDELFRDFVARSHVPGAVWGIVIDGELAHVGAAGVREINTKAPVDADTVFRIGSMTESFTAMAILSAFPFATCSRTPKAFRKTTPGGTGSWVSPTNRWPRC